MTESPLLIASSATALVRSTVRRTEFLRCWCRYGDSRRTLEHSVSSDATEQWPLTSSIVKAAICKLLGVSHNVISIFRPSLTWNVTYSFRTACTTAWVKGDTLGIEAGIVDIDARKEGMEDRSTDRTIMALLTLHVLEKSRWPIWEAAASKHVCDVCSRVRTWFHINFLGRTTTFCPAGDL